MPPFELAAVAGFLARASGAAAVAVDPPRLLAGGAIQQNWGLDATFDGGEFAGSQRLVLRTDAPTGIAPSLGRIAEFAVQKAVFDAGVTVAEPLWACADPAVIGKPFYVMRRVAGTAQGRRITADPALQPHLKTIAARLGRELARIQTVRPPRNDLAFLPQVDAATHIAGFRAYLDRHPHPRPVLEWATAWLEAHLPEPLPPVLCHRDFRTGNYMLGSALPSAPTLPSPASGGGSGRGCGSEGRQGRGGLGGAVDGPELTAILDWEFAGWGDPDEDIGWFCCKGWRFARLDREAGGIADRAAFHEAYEAASGRRLDPHRVRFWEVLANVRWAVIALQQSERHLIGGARDLVTAIIGRRATECDLELLMLLDADKAPSPPSEERAGVRGQTAVPPPPPSPSHAEACPRAARSADPRGAGPSLSRIAGEATRGADLAGRHSIRDLPSGAGLLALGRELLLGELLPLLPPQRHRELRLVATAMAIAEREAAAGEGPAEEVLAALRRFYDAGDSDLLPSLLRRFAADLRAGAFERCESRGRAARAILWRLTILKLREGNPGFLAANGFGE